MNDNFDKLGQTLNAMAAGLTPANRRKVFKAAAKKIREINQKRIRAQTDPDGHPFIPRRKKKLFQPQTAAKFLYPSKTGKSRAVKLVNWTLTNDVYTGHDEYSGGQLKSFRRSKIIRFLPDETPAGGITEDIRTRLHANSIKSRMFKKLATTRYLKEKYNPESIEIGFFGKGARVATEHHYGENTIISKYNQKRIQMPERRLLGITPQDELEILSEVVKILDYDSV